MINILCAALYLQDGKKYNYQPKNIESGLVVCARRHHNCFAILDLISPYKERKAKVIQGFLTSDDNFVDRKEAFKIADEAGQIKSKPLLYGKQSLISEDLY